MKQQYHLPSADKNPTKTQQQQLIIKIHQKQWSLLTPNFIPSQLYYFRYNQNLFYYPAYENTFLTNGLEVNFPQIKHINSQGKILKKINISFSSIFMISNKQVLIWRFQNVYNSYIITQWNLQSDRMLNIVCQNYIGKKIKNQNVRFIVFPQAKLVLLVSILKDDLKNQIKLVSFQFPFKGQKQTPKNIALYSSPEFNLKDQPIKLNHHSKIAWTQIINQNQLLIHIYDINDPNQKIDSLIFRSQLKFDQKLYSLYLVDIWQPMNGKMYLKFQLLINHYKYQNKYPNQKHQQRQKTLQSLEKQQRYFQFVWEYQKDIFQQTSWISSQISQYGIQFMSGLRRISNNYKKIKNSKYIKKQYNSQKYTYFVDQSTFSILHKIKQFDSQSLSNSNLPYADLRSQNRWFPQYNLQIYFECEYKKYENITKIKQANIMKLFFQVKFILVFLLLELIKDCDQDILREVVNLTLKK